MSTNENIVETLIGLLNHHFEMFVELGEDNVPYVTYAYGKTANSTVRFINDLIGLLEDSDLNGKINYYYGNELDFDTPEEFHRY